MLKLRYNPWKGWSWLLDDREWFGPYPTFEAAFEDARVFNQ
jgi:hypothetical protein